MTAVVPCDSGAARDRCSFPAREDRARRPGSRLPSVSVVLGALSIAVCWVFGLGFVLGVAAALCGALATTRPTVVDDEAASLRALLGIVAGVAGIMVSAIALFPVLELL